MRRFAALLAASFLALSGSAHATVIFVTSLGDAGFGALPVLDDFESYAPKDSFPAALVSAGITYTAVTAPCGGGDCPGNVGVTSPGYNNFGIDGLTTTSILAANGNEWFTMTPGFTARRIGFDVYTINAPGALHTVPGAVNVEVSVLTSGGLTTLSLTPPAGNFGFLGVVSDDPILEIEWKASLGGVRNTGIDNIRVSDATAPVPEPASGLLAGLGLAALGLKRRLRRP